MRKIIPALALFGILALPVCGQVRGDLNHDKLVDVNDVSLLIAHILGKSSAGGDNPVTQTFTANGVSFTMVAVEGGTFTMGATPEQGEIFGSDERPTHEVTVSSFSLGQTEVTQMLWFAVMGSNPSAFIGNSSCPVEQVTWDDCQEFLSRLNQLTGMSFRFPSEAEWEYAARGGNKSQGYRYAGSNTLDEVAWYSTNAFDVEEMGPRPVATKAPNELGLYDMTGNVDEWCLDWYNSVYYSSSPSTDPTGPSTGLNRVNRGGGYPATPIFCRLSCRSAGYPDDTHDALGLRVALDSPVTGHVYDDINGDGLVDVNDVSLLIDIIIGKEVGGDDGGNSDNQTFMANGLSFTMIPVEGGTFTMGGTREQGNDVYDREKPTHQVTLSSFSIGQTEVTHLMWFAVMGSIPEVFSGEFNLPVTQVSWDDCQEFISRLNAITGKNFRLPTEAEWEYAARGGNKSKGYKYAGSNTIGDVAWYWNNCYQDGFYRVHVVGTKSPNELGLYDMSGNVAEWCQDWFGDYSSEAQTNPTGPISGSSRVNRGGSWRDDARSCRVSDRYFKYNGTGDDLIGFRIVLPSQ